MALNDNKVPTYPLVAWNYTAHGEQKFHSLGGGDQFEADSPRWISYWWVSMLAS